MVCTTTFVFSSNAYSRKQGIAGVLCSVNEAPFCCSKALYFVDQSHLRLKEKKKKKTGRGGRWRRPLRRGAMDGDEDEDDEDDNDEDDEDDDQYVYFDDGYSLDLGMIRDLQVSCGCNA